MSLAAHRFETITRWVTNFDSGTWEQNWYIITWEPCRQSNTNESILVSSSNPSNFPYKCHNYGKRGHRIIDCYAKRKSEIFFIEDCAKIWKHESITNIRCQMHSIGHARTYMYGILKSAPKQVGLCFIWECLR